MHKTPKTEVTMETALIMEQTNFSAP